MTLATFPYDTADYLDTEEAIAMYAEEALADLNALARRTGLSRRALVEALSGEDPGGTDTLTAALRKTGARTTSRAE